MRHTERMRTATTIAILIGAMLLTSCAPTEGGEDAVASRSGSHPDPRPEGMEPTPAAASFPSGPSALERLEAPEFPASLVDPSEIVSGGPPPDGIPPIDDPTFLRVSEHLGFLPSEEPVVALEIAGDARAYPIRALVWHEIVNDTVGGVPVTVTYCPLCNSAATYERRIDGAETTFGTSGRLFASALVMYDRATESLWTHFDGRAVVGLLAGRQLVEHASPLLSWGDFRSEYPTGLVLDYEAAGFRRDYGRNPYTGYDDPDGTPFLFRGALDERARAMQRVVGVELGGVARAFALEGISGGAGRATASMVGEQPIVIFWKAGQASALEDGSVSGGRDVGSVAVFDTRLDGEVLTFTHGPRGFVDDQTGTSWTITGRAAEGPLAGQSLDPLPHLDTFWFAWSTYRPGTDLVEG